MPSYENVRTTLCGHSATVQEFRRMKNFSIKDVTCQRCLALKQKFINQKIYLEAENDEQKTSKITASI